MELKTILFKITKGMLQDLDNQTSTPDTAYELLNIKAQFNEELSATTLVTEKGSALCTLLYLNEGNVINGYVNGYIQCGYNQIVLFTSDVDLELNITNNCIYRVTYQASTIKNGINLIFKLLAKGNFNIGNNIQGVFNYENSELLKVYWVDGVNSLRFLNIADSNPLFKKNYNFTKFEAAFKKFMEVRKQTKSTITSLLQKTRNIEFSVEYNNVSGIIKNKYLYFENLGYLMFVKNTTPNVFIISEDSTIFSKVDTKGTYKGISFDPSKYINQSYITNSKYLDCKPEFEFNHNFEVNKVSGTGIFPSGVILYAFTYFNEHGAETNIVEVSPLYYITDKNRGLSPEENTSCNFEINILNPDITYDYIRIYSILRTSLDAVPIIRIVKDIKITNPGINLDYMLAHKPQPSTETLSANTSILNNFKK